MDLLLSGKRALVTGGSRGIGKSIALALAQEGVQVALLARDEVALAAAAAEIREQTLGAQTNGTATIGTSTGSQVVYCCADTGSDEQVQLAVAHAQNQLGGPIDILVNAAAEPAGYAKPPTLLEITGDFFHAQLDIKVMGYICCAQAVVPGMRLKGWGRIVNISGLAARQTGNAVGSMRNISVAALTKNMADELGPAGINATVVHPGLTRTERTAAQVAASAQAQGLSADQVLAQMAAGNSIRHLVDASEVANVVLFLCSPKSRAINGDVIAVGGGTPRAIHG